MQIAFIDYQSAVDLNSLTAAFINAGLVFEDWRQSLEKAVSTLNLEFQSSFEGINVQSTQVKRLTLDIRPSASDDEIISVQLILEALDKCVCDNSVLNLSRTVLARILEAEAKIRSIALRDLTFKRSVLERSLLQIVGLAIAIRAMKVDSIFATPPEIANGEGFWSSQQNPEGFSTQIIDLLLCEASAETKSESKGSGAGLRSPAVVSALTTLVFNWKMPSFKSVQKVGYGCGVDGGVCRVLLGELQSNSFRSELISVLEVNLDDLSPQIISFTSEELFAGGALDVFVTPVIMKKGRSGHLLTALCNPEDKEKMRSIIFAQTSTLGVRSYDCERAVAEREFENVSMEDGWVIRVKIGYDLLGNVVNAQPEFEDCAAYARASKLPIQDVMRLALSKLNLKAFIFVTAFIVFLSSSISSSFALSLEDTQFHRALLQAHPHSLKNEGGFEIYSWYNGSKWHYSLLPASKENRTYKDVTDSSVSWKSFVELEAALGKLAPCTVSWRNKLAQEDGKSNQLSLPHQAVLNRLKAYCQSRHIELVY